VPAGPRVQALADVNGDRHLDVVMTHVDAARLSVLLNTGRGGFTAAPGSPYDVGHEAFAVVVADANQDARPDLLVATVDSITVLVGRAQGFAPAPGSPFRAGPGAFNLAAGDVDKNDRIDVAASSFEGSSVALLLGRAR